MDRANQHAERADEVPADLLSVIGHELRGPLGVTRGYLRLLAQGGSLDERQVKAVTEASRAADRMAALLDEVSTYARWARGEVALTTALVALAPLLHGITDALPAGTAVTVSAPEELTVHADAVHLQTALHALATAVARALPDAATLAVIATRTDDGRVHVTLGGESAEAVEERAPDLRRAGVGLGLALAHLVIQAHGGSLAERHAGGRWNGYVIQI